MGIAWNNPSLSGASGPGESGNGFGMFPLRSANLEELGFAWPSRPSLGRNEAGYSGAFIRPKLFVGGEVRYGAVA